jgi:hypothetical protein
VVGREDPSRVELIRLLEGRDAAIEISAVPAGFAERELHLDGIRVFGRDALEIRDRLRILAGRHQVDATQQRALRRSELRFERA